MKEYCNFLNKYEIKIGKVQFEDIMLRRTFRNSDGSFRFLFGGRSGRYWMEYPKAKRRKMTINGKSVAQEPLDFTSSQLNILYAWKLGKKNTKTDIRLKVTKEQPIENHQALNCDYVEHSKLSTCKRCFCECSGKRLSISW